MGALIVLGLGYGDEGKGSLTDFLTRKHGAELVVRFNGGAQAAHNVVCDDGRHHTFSQFGSGTFAGAYTLISRYMLLNPVFLLTEALHLVDLGIEDPLNRLAIEKDAVVTTPPHWAANRLLEMSRTNRHGSCGMGIGETMGHALEHPEEAITARDFLDERVLMEKYHAIRRRMLDRVRPVLNNWYPMPDEVRREVDIILDSGPRSSTRRASTVFREAAEAIRSATHGSLLVDSAFLPDVLKQAKSPVIFEGAQGVLLDQDWGFQPYTTWTDCTFGNTMKLLDGYTGEVRRIGVLRAYSTRHGAGPFVPEDKSFDKLSTHDHNAMGPWQGAFRSGAFDTPSLEYALNVVGGVDEIAMTNLDRLSLYQGLVPVCTGYDFNGDGQNVFGKLLVRRPLDLDWQAEMARTLMGTSPDLERVSVVDPIAYARLVLERSYCKAPLTITSHGPKASDKIDHLAGKTV